MQLSKRVFAGIYGILVATRIGFALLGTGYIHPDEHFQNGEVSAGNILGLHTVRTWEWDSTFPIRSIIPPLVTTGLPFGITKASLGGSSLDPSRLFQLERIVFLGLSFILDYCVSSLIPEPVQRRHGLVLLASSHVMHTFQVRPFSNSIEALIVAICLILLRKNLDRTNHDDSLKSVQLSLFAFFFVTGTFTRITFLAFGLPIGLQVLCWIIQQSKQSSGFPRARYLIPPLVTASITTITFVLADTVFFRRELAEIVVTPLNFVLYNLSPGNLSEHGIHPRWLHLSVNLPIIVGPGIVLLMATLYNRDIKQKLDNTNYVVSQNAIYIIVTSLVALSIQPHQEPRFLMPLLLPFVVLVTVRGNLVRAGKLFWISWVLFNLILSILFGVLHQGGVIPSLFYLHTRLEEGTSVRSVHIVYWKTYMPPRHFLGLKKEEVLSRQITLTDLAGASQNDLVRAVYTTNSDLTFLVTTLAMHSTLPQTFLDCTTMQDRIFPHLDLDHLPESLQAGWKDGVSLGIYVVDHACLTNAPAIL